MIVVGEKGNDFFVNRRILNEKTNGEVKIDLKKIDSTELKKLLIK
jgi:hypothetical protein